MFFRDLVLKSDVKLDVALAEARLPVRLGHRDATSVFGDPLSRQLAAASLGAVTQVRAHEAAPSDVCGVTLHLGLRDASRPGLETVARMLEHLHAPLGSSIRLSDGGQPLMFGVTEGLEIEVDTAHTPDASARRDLAMSCASAMKGFAISRGWTRRADKTLFYFYGESFQKMQSSLARLFEANPALNGATARRLA